MVPIFMSTSYCPCSCRTIRLMGTCSCCLQLEQTTFFNPDDGFRYMRDFVCVVEDCPYCMCDDGIPCEHCSLQGHKGSKKWQRKCQECVKSSKVRCFSVHILWMVKVQFSLTTSKLTLQRRLALVHVSS